MGYIYKIINDINNLIYVGQTKRTLTRRWYEHKKYALESDSKTKLYQAIKTIGVEHFKIQLIEEVFGIEERNCREQYWIEYYNSFQNGYNSTNGGGCFDYINSSQLEKSDKIVELRLNGYSYQKICDQLKCGREKIAKVLKEHNLLNKNALTLRHEEDILNLLRQGVYLTDIQKEAKCDFKTIQRILKQHTELQSIYYDVYYPFDKKIWQLLNTSLTRKEIAQKVHCCERTVYRAIKRKQIFDNQNKI